MNVTFTDVGVLDIPCGWFELVPLEWDDSHVVPARFTAGAVYKVPFKIFDKDSPAMVVDRYLRFEVDALSAEIEYTIRTDASFEVPAQDLRRRALASAAIEPEGLLSKSFGLTDRLVRDAEYIEALGLRRQPPDIPKLVRRPARRYSREELVQFSLAAGSLEGGSLEKASAMGITPPTFFRLQKEVRARGLDLEPFESRASKDG